MTGRCQHDANVARPTAMQLGFNTRVKKIQKLKRYSVVGADAAKSTTPRTAEDPWLEFREMDDCTTGCAFAIPQLRIQAPPARMQQVERRQIEQMHMLARLMGVEHEIKSFGCQYENAPETVPMIGRTGLDSSHLRPQKTVTEIFGIMRYARALCQQVSQIRKLRTTDHVV